MPSSLVMRRLNKLEPKNRVQVLVRLESELVDVMQKNSLNASNLANVGIEKQLIKQGYLPEVAVRADPALLLDPDLIDLIRENRLNPSTVLNAGARMVLREKGLLA
jgi:hypothetical protein